MTVSQAKPSASRQRMALRATKRSKNARAYDQLWRVVDGAVADAFAMHPDYLTAKGAQSARISVTKRVTGAVLGFAEQSAKAARPMRAAADSGVVGQRVRASGVLFPHRLAASAIGSWGRLFTWGAR